MSLTALQPGNTALITGGPSGIGFATAQRLAAKGMNIVMVDLRDHLFAEAEAALKDAGAPGVLGLAADVSDRTAIDALRDQALDRFGRIDVLMCNAGMGMGNDVLGPLDAWHRTLNVNLWGVINCCQSILPGMIDAGQPGLVINTGSKQGITTPPGNPAYNTSKAGVKVYTEALAHHLRETAPQVTAHLLIPGFVFTDLTRGDRTEKPAMAWTADETADFMLESLGNGDFYILCPDNDVDRPTDEKRIAWAAGDIVENRPALSRWHKDWADAFAAYMRDD